MLRVCQLGQTHGSPNGSSHAAVPIPVAISNLPQDLSVQKQATVSTQTAVLPCQSAGDGGTLCGIPIGYEDGTTIVYNRTGVYYLPKVCSPSQLSFVCNDPAAAGLHGMFFEDHISAFVACRHTSQGRCRC